MLKNTVLNKQKIAIGDRIMRWQCIKNDRWIQKRRLGGKMVNCEFYLSTWNPQRNIAEWKEICKNLKKLDERTGKCFSIHFMSKVVKKYKELTGEKPILIDMLEINPRLLWDSLVETVMSKENKLLKAIYD